MSFAGVTLSEFNPRLPWWGGDLQTIRNYALSVDHAMPSRAAQRLVVPLQDGSGDRLVASLHLPRTCATRPLVVLIHGISGCESSCYMVLAAAYFLARGYPVLRVNQRGAGPSRRFCRQQYHAGRTEDLDALFERLDPKLIRNGVLPIGFSLGGNLLLKYLGEAGRQRAGAPRRHGLGAARSRAQLPLADALAQLPLPPLHSDPPQAQLHRRRAPSSASPSARRSSAPASLWQFDDDFTAPRYGYAGAEDFYGANSSQHFLGGIRAPTLLIHAQDDPFVPADALSRAQVGERAPPHAAVAQERRPPRLPRPVGRLAPAPDRGVLRAGLKVAAGVRGDFRAASRQASAERNLSDLPRSRPRAGRRSVLGLPVWGVAPDQREQWLSRGAHAAVEVDRGAGDEGRARRDEERDEVGELLGLAHAAERHAPGPSRRRARRPAASPARRCHWALLIRPMQIVFTRMLSAAYSLASDLVRLIPAARVTLVGRPRAGGALPPTVVTLTIAPPPRARMSGITAPAEPDRGHQLEVEVGVPGRRRRPPRGRAPPRCRRC